MYKRDSSSVGKAPVKATTLTNLWQAVLWPAGTFGHPRKMFLDFAKQSSTISKSVYYIFSFAHVLREDIVATRQWTLGKRFSLFLPWLWTFQNTSSTIKSVICSPELMPVIFVSHLYLHRLNIQQLWWIFYTILLKQAHLTNDQLALVPTQSKIQYSH